MTFIWLEEIPSKCLCKTFQPFNFPFLDQRKGYQFTMQVVFNVGLQYYWHWILKSSIEKITDFCQTDGLSRLIGAKPSLDEESDLRKEVSYGLLNSLRHIPMSVKEICKGTTK